VNINDCFKILAYLVDKYQGTDISPEEFNRIFPMAERSYFDMLSGGVEDFQPGRPVSTIGLGMGNNVNEPLAAFMQTSTLTISSGSASVPANLFKSVSMRTSANIDIIRVDHAKLGNKINSSIDAPTLSKPCYNEIGSTYRFYPTSLTTANLTFIRLPIEPVWGYTIVSGRPVYNPSTSIQSEFGDADLNKIIMRAVGLVGISINDQLIIQAANQVKLKGE
jgi:hypothetical protein